jgi:hypothetical protein
VYYCQACDDPHLMEPDDGGRPVSGLRQRPFIPEHLGNLPGRAWIGEIHLAAWVRDRLAV